jgi:YD repeat-containing protein
MKIFKFLKLMSLVLFSVVLLSGCSGKSGGDTQQSDQPVGVENLKVNVGADQNITENTEFTVTAEVSGNEMDGLTYEWKDGDTVLGNTQTLTQTIEGHGEHAITLTVKNSKGDKATDTVSIKIGKYIISREYVDADGDGVIDSVKIYTHNDAGRLLSISEYRDVDGEKYPENNGMSPFSKIDYTYDEEGNLISKTVNGIEVKEPISTTDANGVKTIINPDGTKIVDEYDENGINTKHSTYDANGNLSYETVAIVAPEDNGVVSKGQVTERKEYDGTHTLLKTTTYEYTSLPDGGFEAIAITKDANGNTLQTIKSTFDKNENLLSEETTGADGNVIKSIQSTYDEKGNLTQRTITDAEGNTVTIDYDENGNPLSTEDGKGTLSYEYRFIYKY